MRDEDRIIKALLWLMLVMVIAIVFCLGMAILSS